MASHVTVRAACVGDAARIVELVRGGFASELVGSFIYGCRGIEAYVAQQIAAASLGVDTQYFVAERGGEIVACSEMRVMAERLFLSYIAVATEARQQRIGSRLLRDAIDAVARGGQVTFSLDVLEDNSSARTWYDALGMRLERIAAWYDLPLTRSDRRSAGPVVSGLVQALVAHRTFGFGQFAVISGGQTHSIGMLGDHLFRLTSPAALVDEDLLACLARIDANRRILAVVPDAAYSANVAPFTRTLRMTAGLSDVRRRLGEVA